jgi:V8-like Glu-specific endopeptidase
MWKFTELTYFLASLYYRHEEIISLIVRAGLKPQKISQSSNATVFWTNVIEYAEKIGKLHDLVSIILGDGHEQNEYLKALADNLDTSYKSPYSSRKISNEFPVDKKDLEKLTDGTNSILPISFLEDGIIKSRSVARIVTKGGLGSGFITKNSYLLTNNHVIDSIKTASNAKVQLNYQLDSKGLLMKFKEFYLEPAAPNGFMTSLTNDWTLVKMKNFTEEFREEFGHIDLKSVNVTKGDYVNIIQHPAGEHKQIALYHNVVVGFNNSRIQYLTDTLPGSSGSPVFNSKWEVVALHHAGSRTKIIDSPTTALINEGININLILKEILELNGSSPFS